MFSANVIRFIGFPANKINSEIHLLIETADGLDGVASDSFLFLNAARQTVYLNIFEAMDVTFKIFLQNCSIFS